MEEELRVRFEAGNSRKNGNDRYKIAPDRQIRNSACEFLFFFVTELSPFPTTIILNLQALTNENEQIARIIEGCRKNDRASQKDLYEMLKSFAVKTSYTYGAANVEENTHQAFIKLFRHIHRFELNRSPDLLLSLKGWFKRIIINTCIDSLRKDSQNKNIRLLDQQTESIQDNSGNGFDKLSYQDVLFSIRALSPAYRNVFNLYVMDGYTHEEISFQLGISIGASKSNLSKARAKLREILTRRSKPVSVAQPESFTTCSLSH